MFISTVVIMWDYLTLSANAFCFPHYLVVLISGIRKKRLALFFFFFLIATNWDSSLLRKTDYLISSIHVDTQSLKCFFPLSHVLFHINIYEKYSMCLIYFWKTATTSITKWYISCYITAIFKCRNGTMGSLD